MASEPSIEDLDGAFERLFENGAPRDLPTDLGEFLNSSFDSKTVDELLISSVEGKQSLASIFQSNTYHGRPRNKFSSQELKSSFELFPSFGSGSNVPGVLSSAPSLIDSSSSSSLAPQVPSSKELQVITLSMSHFITLNDTVLFPFYLKLSTLKWLDWPYNNGNPFSVKITTDNCAELGVPTYFDIIKKPMDLSRIYDRIDKAKRGQKPYERAEDFLQDCYLICQNAKLFNFPVSTSSKSPTITQLPNNEYLFPDPMMFDQALLKKYPVYKMAFEFEAIIKEFEPNLLSSWNEAMKNMKLAYYMELKQQMK
jgi:Bromodomain